MQISISASCHKSLQHCLDYKKLTKKREERIVFFENDIALLSFKSSFDFKKLRKYFAKENHTKDEQRKVVQRILKQLNTNSISKHQKKISDLLNDEVIITHTPISITNSLLIRFRPQYKKKIVRFFDEPMSTTNSEKDTPTRTKGNARNSLENSSAAHTQSVLNIAQKEPSRDQGELAENQLGGNQQAHQQINLPDINKNNDVRSIHIALVDSGVSIQHQEFSHLKNFKQYNPEDGSFKIKDTGFGHGTGVLSLLAASNQYQRTISTLPKASYLGCNGLPSGKYHYIWVISCFDWLIQQPKVDIVVNSWLQPELKCNDELLYPLRALWLANSIPIFSAGNFGQATPSTRDPVNFALFDDLPLLSVGAIDASGTPLDDSSYANNVCGNNVKSPTVTAPGENLIVASPFQKDSYQITSGTSYSVTFVATALAMMIDQSPEASHELIVNTLISSTKTSEEEPEQTINLLNVHKALKQLSDKVSN